MARILVIDDSATSRLLLVTLLGYAQHEVLEAGDAAEGLAIVRARIPDLVITDIVMPAMSGIELVHHLRADRALAHIPVIFYTASDRWDEAWSLAQACAVFAVIGKPAEPDLLFDTVAAAIGLAAPR